MTHTGDQKQLIDNTYLRTAGCESLETALYIKTYP